MRINEEDYTEEELETMREGGSYYICEGTNDIYDDEDDGAYVNGYWYSLDYLENSDDYYRCDDCGAWTFHEDLTYISNTCEDVCEDCYNYHDYFYCDNCGNYFSGSGNSTENEYLCDDCYEEYCDEHDDDDCYGGNDSRIYSYHGFSDWTPFKLEEEKNPYYIGFELEIICKQKSNTSQILDIFEEAWPVVFMRDGSLDDGGVEVISHPFTMKYFEKNKNKLKQAFDQVRKLGAISHDARCCGLHFHFTRPKSNDSVNKMWLVLKTYQDEMLKYSRRDFDDFRHWTAMIGGTKDTYKLKTLEYINKIKDGSGRYMALNNTNSKTIEFRMFRGTLIFESFVASIELVNNLYKACISNKDLCKINWQYLTSTKYAKKYAIKNNITSNKIVKDYSIEYNKQLKQANKYITNALTILSNAYNDYLKKVHPLKASTTDDFTDASSNLRDARSLLNCIISCKMNDADENFASCLSYIDDGKLYVKKDEDFFKINDERNKLSKLLEEGGI